MQWRPLLPEEGELIEVDIGGHPLSPTGPNHVFGNFDNLLFLAVFNFWGHFEALNDVFLENEEKHGLYINVSHPKVVFIGWIFPTSYHAPQTEIVCKSYAPGKLTYQLPPSGPTNLLAFHLLGLRFWMCMVLSFMNYVKKEFRASL